MKWLTKIKQLLCKHNSITTISEIKENPRIFYSKSTCNECGKSPVKPNFTIDDFRRHEEYLINSYRNWSE